MSFVLDSSVAMTWCFKDELTEVTDGLLTRTTNGGAHAPSLWPLEVVNVLLAAERRGRVTPDESRECLAFLSSLPVVLDTKTAEQAWTTSNALSHRFGLTLYDAAYLELAGRLDLPLATLDKDLRSAAKKCGVSLLESVAKIALGRFFSCICADQARFSKRICTIREKNGRRATQMRQKSGPNGI